MADELKPCPFCGGDASGDGHIRYNSPLPDTWWEDGAEITEAFFVNCVKCGIANGTRGLVSGYRTKAEAITAWNTRTETQSQATIDELVGALERCRNRFRRCIISGGTDEEYADAAVAEYDTILSRHKGEGK